MRVAIAFAVSALVFASPALATGGFECRPVSGAGPVLNISFGHTISARPFRVTLHEETSTFSTDGDDAQMMLGQSWIDDERLWLDLVDPQLSRYEAKLRATFDSDLHGRPAIGTLVRGGKTYRVRCVEA